MAKQTLTESQITGLELLNASMVDDTMADEDFTKLLFELKDSGVDVESELHERYGVEF